MNRRRTLLASCLALAFAALPGAALAQSGFPNKPVRLVVPFGAGGLSDTVARVIGQALSTAWNQQVLVENKPGAGGIAASEQVAKSPADGYTLLMADPQHLSINPALYPKLPYDPIKDFTPVTLAAYGPLFLAVGADVPAKTFAELVALARAKPGSLNYGSAGSGSIHHLSTESLKAALNIDVVHVPYKGAAQAVQSLIAGQITMAFAAYPALAPQVKAGKARILAVSTGKRTRLAPDVPALSELGVTGYDFAGQIGFVAPAGTPRDVITKLNADIVRVLRDPAMVERMAGLGIDPVGNTPEEYERLIRTDLDKFGRAVKVSGAKAE
jgi:tripartite-type tricarboxylate transporter receptor subunit TctC